MSMSPEGIFPNPVNIETVTPKAIGLERQADRLRRIVEEGLKHLSQSPRNPGNNPKPPEGPTPAQPPYRDPLTSTGREPNRPRVKKRGLDNIIWFALGNPNKIATKRANKAEKHISQIKTALKDELFDTNKRVHSRIIRRAGKKTVGVIKRVNQNLAEHALSSTLQVAIPALGQAISLGIAIKKHRWNELILRSSLVLYGLFIETPVLAAIGTSVIASLGLTSPLLLIPIGFTMLVNRSIRKHEEMVNYHLISKLDEINSAGPAIGKALQEITLKNPKYREMINNLPQKEAQLDPRQSKSYQEIQKTREEIRQQISAYRAALTGSNYPNSNFQWKSAEFRAWLDKHKKRNGRKVIRYIDELEHIDNSLKEDQEQEENPYLRVRRLRKIVDRGREYSNF